MKRTYKKPEAKAVDFSYDTQVTAASPTPPPGYEFRPDNDYYCQYFTEWGACTIVVSPSIQCGTHAPGVMSLR